MMYRPLRLLVTFTALFALAAANVTDVGSGFDLASHMQCRLMLVYIRDGRGHRTTWAYCGNARTVYNDAFGRMGYLDASPQICWSVVERFCAAAIQRTLPADWVRNIPRTCDAWGLTRDGSH